jgi:hypothetical protein
MAQKAVPYSAPPESGSQYPVRRGQYGKRLRKYPGAGGLVASRGSAIFSPQCHVGPSSCIFKQGVKEGRALS